MKGDPDVDRVVIEFRRAEGPMSGRFLAEGQDEPQRFSGWLELLALLENARVPADQPAGSDQEEDQ
jgi:hypothetical protein